jgi:DNA-binding NarL/FixJ family response regulator
MVFLQKKEMEIGIVDDNAQLSKQLIQKLSLAEEVTILFNVDRGRKAIEWLKENPQKPDIILMDIEMPDMDGIETTFRIKQQYPGIKILMLTVFESEDKIFNAIKAGATGYLLKDEKLDRMLQAFEEINEGGVPMSRSIAAKSLQMMLKGYKPEGKVPFNQESDEQLTKREIEILENLSHGLKNQEIADKLFISRATVKKHIENIYLKLQLKSRVELVNWYRNA